MIQSRQGLPKWGRILISILVLHAAAIGVIAAAALLFLGSCAESEGLKNSAIALGIASVAAIPLTIVWLVRGVSASKPPQPPASGPDDKGR
jgi:hypothetical protein